VNIIIHGNLSSIFEFHPQKLEWKVHVIFIHWKFTNDIQWIYEQFWIAWVNCNGIMGDQGEIKCWFNCWNSSQLNHKWEFSGCCVNYRVNQHLMGVGSLYSTCGLWFKVSNYHPKTQQPNFFPLLVEFLSVLWRKKKIHWNRKGLRQKGLMEDRILEF
jgi:hypothetical protein